MYVVEVAQRDAVEPQHLRADSPILLENRAHGLRHVAVEDEVQRPAALDAALEREGEPARERGQALVGRRAGPAEREREFTLPFVQIEVLEMLADCLGHVFLLYFFIKRDRRLQHLQGLGREEVSR